MNSRLKARLLFAPTLAWNALLGRVLKVRRWWDEIDPAVVLGALPFAADVPRLAAAGITAVVNTCEEYGGPITAYERFGIEQLRVPIVDFTHPTLAEVEKAVKFMENKVDAGGKVYVHCKAGRGRSATVAACWLMAARRLNRHEAQLRLSQCRPHVNPRIFERPVVIEFERRIRGRA
jgi:atypical dual specificity phosphatase